MELADINLVITPFHYMNFTDFRAGEFTAFCPWEFYGGNADVIAFDIPAVTRFGLFFDATFARDFTGRARLLIAAIVRSCNITSMKRWCTVRNKNSARESE